MTVGLAAQVRHLYQYLEELQHIVILGVMDQHLPGFKIYALEFTPLALPI